MNELVKAIPLNTLNELEKAGELLAQSGMFGAKNKAEGFVIAATCQAEGISLMSFIREYHIIEGRPSMRAEAMLAKLVAVGGKYQVIERSPEKATIKVEIDGREATESFTWQEAKTERYVYGKDGKTLKDNWSTPRRRKQMLWARLVSDTIRFMAPQINSGIYTPEETMDFDQREPEEKVINPEAAANMVQNLNSDDKPVEPVDAEIVPENVTEIDYSICPLPGALFNRPWDEMSDKNLEKALKVTHSSMVEKHKDFIKKVLIDRKEIK